MLHSSCYHEILQENNRKLFPCPLCKALCEIYLPNFSSFKLEENKQLFKGTQMCELFPCGSGSSMIKIKDINEFCVSEFAQQLIKQAKRFIVAFIYEEEKDNLINE